MIFAALVLLLAIVLWLAVSAAAGVGAWCAFRRGALRWGSILTPIPICLTCLMAVWFGSSFELAAEAHETGETVEESAQLEAFERALVLTATGSYSGPLLVVGIAARARTAYREGTHCAEEAMETPRRP